MGDLLLKEHVSFVNNDNFLCQELRLLLPVLSESRKILPNKLDARRCFRQLGCKAFLVELNQLFSHHDEARRKFGFTLLWQQIKSLEVADLNHFCGLASASGLATIDPVYLWLGCS